MDGRALPGPGTQRRSNQGLVQGQRNVAHRLADRSSEHLLFLGRRPHHPWGSRGYDRRVQYAAHGNGTASLAFSGHDVISGGGDGDVVIADGETGSIKRRFKVCERGGVWSIALIQNAIATTGSYGDGVNIWDLQGTLLQ